MIIFRPVIFFMFHHQNLHTLYNLEKYVTIFVVTNFQSYIVGNKLLAIVQ
jgi:hypothetical protein